MVGLLPEDKGQDTPASPEGGPAVWTEMVLTLHDYTITLSPDVQNIPRGGQGMARLNADVPDELRKRLLHALVDEGISFAEWLRRQVEAYLKERDPKGKRRKGREA